MTTFTGRAVVTEGQTFQDVPGSYLRIDREPLNRAMGWPWAWCSRTQASPAGLVSAAQTSSRVPGRVRCTPIWKATPELEHEEFMSQAREVLRDLIVLLGMRLEASPKDRADCLAPLVEDMLNLREKFRQNQPSEG